MFVQCFLCVCVCVVYVFCVYGLVLSPPCTLKKKSVEIGLIYCVNMKNFLFFFNRCLF